jgi:hypothetical protein
VNIYRAEWPKDSTDPAPGFDQALRVGSPQVGMSTFSDPVGVGKRYVYWAKNYTINGVEQLQPTGTTVGADAAGVVGQTTKIGNDDLADLVIEAGKLKDGTISADKLAADAVQLTNFASGIEPVGVITGDSLPTEKTTSVIVFGGKLYRWNGAAYESKFDAEDVVGVLTDEQIQQIDAAKIVGQLVADQIAAAAIEADKFASGIEPVTIVTGASLPSVKSTSTVFYGGKLYRWSATQERYVSNVDASDLIGTITSASNVNVEVDGVSIPIVEVAQNAAVPAINYIGEFALAPSTTGLKANAVYKNSGNGISYILTGTPLAWQVYLEGGVDFDVQIESEQGTTFRVGQARHTLLKARIFRNGVEVTDDIPAARFRWRRVSYDPQPAPNDDTTWNAAYASGYKQIDVSVDDVAARATFHCDLLGEG